MPFKSMIIRKLIPTRAVRGTSMTELLLLTAVILILLALVTPSFNTTLDRYRLKSATEKLYYMLYATKSEAIKRNSRIRLTFKTSASGAKWCYGLKIDAACDCNFTGSCSIDGIEKVVNSQQFPGIKLETHISSPGDRLTFNNVHWIMQGTFGHVRFISPQGKQTRVIVSRMSKFRLCSPIGSENVAGYSTAC
jgi:type IV fimbrial biogenesis protein FimT